MPLPFEDFQGKGGLEIFSSSSSTFYLNTSPQNQRQQQKWQTNNNNNNNNNNNDSKENCCFVGSEPTSVLDTRRSPSPPTSSSTLSSSQGGANGGGGGGGATTDTIITTTTAAVSVEEKCGQHPQQQHQQLGMEDWESVLPGSPSQEQSILGLIMGDIEDPSVGLNKLLQPGVVSCNNNPDLEQQLQLNAATFGVVDQVFGFEAINRTTTNLVNNIIGPPLNSTSDFPPLLNASSKIQNPNHNPGVWPGLFQQQQAVEEKPQIFNHPQVVMSKNQANFSPNPAMFLPLSCAQLQDHHQDHQLLTPPPPKRLNSGPNIGANYHQVPKLPFSDPRPELYQSAHHHPQQQQLRPGMMKQKILSDELANMQAVINPICQAAELIETGNPVLAQGILARLNHQLSLPIGKPYHRAAFYFKEALQLLLQMNTPSTAPVSNACSLIFKIGAYKSFSEISPVVQFANFTCNQALLEAFEGVDRIHILDFDIGYGGQWASLMQELAMRNGGAPSLKITAFASPSSHDELELGFTQENLRIFASEINMPFELEILALESLINSSSFPVPVCVSEKEVSAVNLPIGSFANNPSALSLVLRCVKQLSPKIVVSLDRNCDRTDLPFAHQVHNAIQSCSSLLESLDAVNVNVDALQNIERFLVQPGIEKMVLGRRHCPDRTPPWRSLFMQSGFVPLTFSNFTESQAECLVQRTPGRGFQVEKRQSSLVLCWQRKELISASAWRC